MKNILTVLLFFVSLLFSAKAQNTTPQLLKGPVNWQFERFALPPAFAPSFPFKGAEELRFSPGMFKKDSLSYFSYAFVAELDNTNSVSQNDIKNYLLQYFKGLCSSTATERKLVIDTSKINVAVTMKETPGKQIIYNAVLNIFGVFADGAPVKLNMEIEVLFNSAAKKTYLVFIASPKNKTDKIWTELYTIRKNFTIPK